VIDCFSEKLFLIEISINAAQKNQTAIRLYTDFSCFQSFKTKQNNNLFSYFQKDYGRKNIKLKTYFFQVKTKCFYMLHIYPS